MELTQKCVEEILEITENGKNIAINIDYDGIRHFLYLKETFNDIFSLKNLSITFYTIRHKAAMLEGIKCLERYQNSINGMECEKT